MLDRRFHPLPACLLLLSLLAAVPVLGQRFRVERANRRVQLVLDDEQLRALCAATGVTPQEAYRRVGTMGVSGVAVTEPTLAEALQMGLVRYNPLGSDRGLLAPAPGQEERVAAAFATALPATDPSGGRLAIRAAGGARAFYGASLADLLTLGMGCDPMAVREITAAGLEPVGRIYAYPGATAANLPLRLGLLREMGIHTLIFAGEEAAGFPGLLAETAAAMRQHRILYGSVEFGKQRGDSRLSALMADRLVRVHSVSPAEMNRLAPGEAIERYARAASERNIRLAYVRLPAGALQGGFRGAEEYLQRLARTAVGEGFGLAPARPFQRMFDAGPAARALRGAVGMGVGAAAVMLLAALFPVSGRRQVALALPAAALSGLAAALGVPLLLKLMALLAALVLPVLAFVARLQPTGAFAERDDLMRTGGRGPAPVLLEFAAVSAWSLAAGLLIAGLLSELEFLVKVESFAGIKLATALPILVVGAVYLTGASGGAGSLAEEIAGVKARLSAFLEHPLRVWHTVALFAGVIALGLVLARSGNDAGVGVSDLELRFRALLDQALGIRPRTKEFLIGHPALLLGLALSGRPRYRRWAFPLLLVGVIGQVGMVNSFCHLHTPIKLTLLRTFNGLWSGALIGLLILAAWRRFERAAARASAQ